MAFVAIHTLQGLSAIASAEATGTPVNLTHMAVGDGNGNDVTPNEAQGTLVREVFRAPVNRVYQYPGATNKFVAELIIPASAGGFTIREAGVIDANGGLHVVASLPETYKPTLSEGAFVDTVVKVVFEVTNASVISLQVDPNVAVATQAWVISNINAAHIIPGGETDQILTKASNADGDVEWRNPTDVNLRVSSVEETQTLAAAQTVVNWATVTNTGLAVYVNGLRLRHDEWTPHATINTRITLAASYPAGTKIVGAQNEPASTMPDPLAKSQNLGDVLDKAQARANLEVYSKAESDQAGQPGDIKFTARTTPPPGWLKANGVAVSRTAYAALFAAIGTTYGNGDGFNTFNLPDLRGEFIRGFDDNRGVDPNRTFGSNQADAFRSHAHAQATANGAAQNPGREVPPPAGGPGYGIDYSDGSGPVMTQATGGAETRPRNVALLACIKT